MSSFPKPPAEFGFGPITRTDLVRYAGASGDMNPLHHDETYARKAGLDTVMGHGMFSAGILSSFLRQWVGRRQVRRFRVRFVAPVWPGDRLLADGEVVGRGSEQGISCMELTLSLRREDGAEVVKGRAMVEERLPST